MVSLLLFQACTSIHSMQGAKTIEPDTWEIAMGASLQQNNAVSLTTGLPAPQMVLSTRYGWRPNIDVGTQLYLGGGAVDVRYQFARVGDWYLAIAPTVTGLYAGVYGNVHLTVPIRGQTSLNDKWDMVLGVTPGTQHYLIQLDPLSATLPTSTLGNTLRVERHGQKVHWGFTLDSLYPIGRAAPVGLSYGLDISWVRERKQRTTD